MSHIVTYPDTEFKDVNTFQAACQRLGLQMLPHGPHTLFSSTVTGHAVKLSNWEFPIVVNFENGMVQFDNYNGDWGDIAELHKLKQAYKTEAIAQEYRIAGYSVNEYALEDGSIKLELEQYA